MPAGWVAAAGAVIGGVVAANGASDAADTQADATRDATNAQSAQARQTREDLTPYRETGYRALGTLENEINTPTSAADVTSDPGYQFGLLQGQLGLDRKAAASGGRVSGAALKAASEYATNYATTGYGAAYQRRQDRLNRLAALANIGQTATGNSAAAGAQATGAISGLISAQGNANAASQLAQGNIWGNTTNQLGAIGQRWASSPSSNTQTPTDQVPWQTPSGMESGYG